MSNTSRVGAVGRVSESSKGNTQACAVSAGSAGVLVNQHFLFTECRVKSWCRQAWGKGPAVSSCGPGGCSEGRAENGGLYPVLHPLGDHMTRPGEESPRAQTRHLAGNPDKGEQGDSAGAEDSTFPVMVWKP